MFACMRPASPPTTEITATATAGDQPQDTRLLPGLVIVNYGKQALVEDRVGELTRCVMRRNLERVVCGDRVQWRRNTDGSGVIEAIESRQSVLQRTAGNRAASPLAANLDQLVITCAPEPGIDLFLVDKYTVAAELAGLEPLIVVNKSDLLDNADREETEARLACYQAIGYQCLLTSALHNTGMALLRAQLRNKTSILAGQSGVGKSSLIGRLLPDLDIEIGRLSAASGQGRHTTTATTLYHMPEGGDLVDSPGVRDFHPGAMNPGQLAHGFREFRGYDGQCRFSDCLHNGEPECAVAVAVAAQLIDARRMQSYHRMLEAQTG